MTQEAAAVSLADAPVVLPKGRGIKPITPEEIAETFQVVSQDIEDIGQLLSQEKVLVAQFLELLQKSLSPFTSNIGVSPSELPLWLKSAVQADLDLAGRLALTFEDGHREVWDLSEVGNRDLLIVVAEDIVPKLAGLMTPSVEEEEKVELLEPIQVVEEISAPAPPEIPVIFAIEGPKPLPALPTELLAPPPEPAVEEPEEILPQPEVPAFDFAEYTAKVEVIAQETLGYLELLGGEVFEQAPVSKYFDDWMVNLRQIILSFESSEVIGPDEAFTQEYNRIFTEIEDELAKRQATEADIEVSARTLVENRYLLNKIDQGYAAQSKDLVVRGKSAIEYLMRNMQNIEKELAEVQQIKTSYRHPLQKMAKDQKVAELTQKLNAAKKRLAIAVGTSSVDKGKSGDIDAEFAAQSSELEEKRKVAMEFLAQNVQQLQQEIDEVKKANAKTSNPIKRVANQQQLFELNEKLLDAKKRLELAEKNSSAEMETLRAEYERKKQAALGKVQTLEKDIAAKAVDNSAEVRKEACRALAETVKALAQKKTSLQPAARSEAKQVGNNEATA